MSQTPDHHASHRRTTAAPIAATLGALGMLLSLGACAGNVTQGAGAGGAPVEVEVDPSHGWQLSVGAYHACVKSPSGHVACWGANWGGQLGLGDTDDRSTPSWVPGLDNVVEIAAAATSTCAIRADESVWCWGDNSYGELGAQTEQCADLPLSCSSVPVQAATAGAQHLTPGAGFSCATVGSQAAFECWGSAPNLDTSGMRVLGASAAQQLLCVIFEPGAGEDPARNVICRGLGYHGSLGTGDAFDGPVADGPPGGFVELASGAEFSCGIGQGHEVYCWGSNWMGSLGVGVSANLDVPGECTPQMPCSKTPIEVGGLPPIAHIAARDAHACAVDTDGSVHCWGATFAAGTGGFPCMGESAKCSPTPTVVAGIAGATAVGVGSEHACALGASGQVSCWGANENGQLGSGSASAYEAAPAGVTLPPEPN